MATRDDSSDNEGETTKCLQRGFTTGDEVRKPVGVFVYYELGQNFQLLGGPRVPRCYENQRPCQDRVR